MSLDKDKYLTQAPNIKSTRASHEFQYTRYLAYSEALKKSFFPTESEFDSVENTNCTLICPKCDFFNFSDSFFADQLNFENQNRFDPLANGSGTKASQTGSDKHKFISGLKFVSININSIRGKKLELLAFLDFHQPKIVAIQGTKLTAPYQPQNCFRNLVHIMCIEKIEP